MIGRGSARALLRNLCFPGFLCLKMDSACAAALFERCSNDSVASQHLQRHRNIPSPRLSPSPRVFVLSSYHPEVCRLPAQAAVNSITHEPVLDLAETRLSESPSPASPSSAQPHPSLALLDRCSMLTGGVGGAPTVSMHSLTASLLVWLGRRRTPRLQRDPHNPRSAALPPLLGAIYFFQHEEKRPATAFILLCLHTGHPAGSAIAAAWMMWDALVAPVHLLGMRP